MTGWTDPAPDPHPQQPRSLAADLLSFGPASTAGREFLAAVLQLGAVVLLLFVFFPDRFSETTRWMLVVGAGVYFTFRAAAGIPKWRRRER